MSEPLSVDAFRRPTMLQHDRCAGDHDRVEESAAAHVEPGPEPKPATLLAPAPSVPREIALASAIVNEIEWGRLRDTYLARARLDQDIEEFVDVLKPPLGDHEPVLVVKTRTGGGNRDEYEDCIAAIQKHERYLYDHDWDCDCTYAFFYFHLRDAGVVCSYDGAWWDAPENKY